MFKKTKTVAGICTQFTQDLEAIKISQELEAEKQEALENKAKLAKEAAVLEGVGAAKAILNIKEMFGIE